MATSTPVLTRSLGLLRPWRVGVALALLLLVATTAVSLAGPWVLRYAIDHGLDGTADLPSLRRAALAYLGVAAVALLLTRAQTALVGRIGEGFVRLLRERVFSHMLSLPPRFFDSMPSGTLVSRMTSDIDALQLLIEMGMVNLIQAAITLAVLATMLVVLSWKLALACLVLGPPLVLATLWFRRHSEAAYLALRDRVADTVATVVEGINGVREIQSTQQQDRMLTTFRARNEAQFQANVRSVWAMAWYLPWMEFIPVAGACIALGLGGWMVSRDTLSVGTLSAFLLYVQLTFEPVQSVSALFTQAQSAGAALRKEFVLLDTVSDLPYGDSPLARGGALALTGVGYRYAPHGPSVLAGIDLVIAPGENLALVGPTGAGKSTLAKVMARFDDPTSGVVTYGGVDLRTASHDALRARITMVTQDGHLCAGTVRENIRLARPEATDADVAVAAARIGASSVFEALPLGLETQVGQAGSLLSAGQRQLVALSRAALSDSDVLILDEATSDLDPGTELAVTAATETLMRGRTTIVIAHRLSTILRADRIAVIRDGGISELGGHDELVALGGHYAALYATWQPTPG